MLTEAHYRSVLGFFYFLLLDEGMAISASFKVVKLVQKKSRKNPSEPLDILMIQNMSRVLEKYRAKYKITSSAPPQSDWKAPKPENLIAWKEFMRKAEPPFSMTLVLRYILGYEPKTIAEALNVPEGTVHYRIGRGLESFSEVRK